VLSINSFPETDWKTLTRLKEVALERLCQRLVEQAAQITRQPDLGTSQERYASLRQHIIQSDEILERCFDDWRRSTAVFTLANWRQEQLLTEAEYLQFSEATRDKVNSLFAPFSE